MTRYSSELPPDPVRIDHLGCGASAIFAVEWPPRIVICTTCGTVLRLVGHNDDTQQLSYRKL